MLTHLVLHRSRPPCLSSARRMLQRDKLPWKCTPKLREPEQSGRPIMNLPKHSVSVYLCLEPRCVSLCVSVCVFERDHITPRGRDTWTHERPSSSTDTTPSRDAKDVSEQGLGRCLSDQSMRTPHNPKKLGTLSFSGRCSATTRKDQGSR